MLRRMETAGGAGAQRVENELRRIVRLEEASELGGDDVGVVLGPVVVESGRDDAAGVWEVLVEEVSCLGGVVRAVIASNTS